MPAQSSRSFTPNGHAGEGAGIVAARHCLIDGFGSGAGQALVEVHEGVEVVVAGGDRGQARVEHLDGLALPCPHRLSDLDGGLVHGFGP